MCSFTKKKYYEDLRLSDVNNDKKFAKTFTLSFGNKIKRKSQTAFIEGDKLVTDGKRLAKA